MKVLIFGATGMVGQGVLRECLQDARVTGVVTVGRQATGQVHSKLTEVVAPDLYDLTALEGPLSGCGACYFCLGVSAAGLSEAEYRHVTYDLTLSVAQRLVRLNPAMTFIYVSGQGTDASSRMRWARVKGQTEAALQALPFRAVSLFRPGFIQPTHGVVSKTGWYRAVYAVLGPLYPVLRALAPGAVTTNEAVGRAMLAVTFLPRRAAVVTTADINALAGA